MLVLVLDMLLLLNIVLMAVSVMVFGSTPWCLEFFLLPPLNKRCVFTKPLIGLQNSWSTNVSYDNTSCQNRFKPF